MLLNWNLRSSKVLLRMTVSDSDPLPANVTKLPNSAKAVTKLTLGFNHQ